MLPHVIAAGVTVGRRRAPFVDELETIFATALVHGHEHVEPCAVSAIGRHVLKCACNLVARLGLSLSVVVVDFSTVDAPGLSIDGGKSPTASS